MSINRLARIFLITLVVLLLLVIAAVSPLGSPLLTYVANKYVPGLSVDDISGSLLTEVSVENLSWQNDQWQITLTSATLSHQWSCLLDNHLCIDSLSATSPHIRQTGKAESADDAPDSNNDEITLPVTLSVDSLQVTDVRFESPDVSVSLAALRGQATWINGLSVNNLALEALTVDLPAAPATPEHTTQALSLSYTAPTLPEVSLPLAVEVNNLTITQVSVTQAGAPLAALDIALAHATMRGSELTVDALQVAMPQVSGQLSGEINLANTYPLSLNVVADTPVEQTTQHSELNVQGDLNDLALELRSAGYVSAALSGNVNLLSDNLPLSLQLVWPAQSVPIVTALELDEGVLSVQGSLGEYALQLDGGAELTDISPLKVKLNAVLSDTSLAVSALHSELLGGQLTNAGVLYFSDGLSWDGITQFNNIDLKGFAEQAPDNLDGMLKAQVIMGDKGPNVLISDIRLTGHHYNQAFSLAGNAVYSANSDVWVGDLSGQLAGNNITAMGQVLNQQYLDAQVAIDINNLSVLYPDIAGQITGSALVKGEWTSPVIDSTIRLTDVQASPVLSQGLADQGPLNGDIKIEGSLAKHQLTADLTLPEHTTSLHLSGQWQAERWQGVISDSQVAILNTLWQQQSDVHIDYQVAKQHFTISDHCWQAREEGSLCVNAIAYTPERVTWDIRADALPVGLWVDELMPDLLVERNNATLTIVSNGELIPDNQQISGQFKATVTPDSWRLAGNAPITINVDKMTIDGAFADEQLTLSSAIISPEVGEIASQATIIPFAQTPQIDGSVTISGWQLAPFKPLIANMEALNGQINGEVALSGALTRPRLHGQLTLQDGTIDSDDLPVTISNWRQSIELNGDSATFEGEYLLGDGPGTLNGDVSWQDELLVTINVKGDAFTVNYDDSKVKVSPDLTVNLNPRSVDISGGIDIPYARIKIKELPPSAITPSSDVHLRGEPPSTALIDNINADVNVTIDNNKTQEVRLDAFGLTASLSGGINVQTQPALTGYGDLQILNGRYKAWGQNLIIRTGEVQFNGPLDQPLLLVEAIRDPELTENDVIAGVRIEGPATQPSVNLFSEPGMDQGQNLAYLLNGSGSLGDSQADENAYTAMLIGFGLSSAGGLTSNVGNALGIEDFAVTTTGQGDATKVAISGKIAPNLTVRYGVGMFSNEESGGQEVALRYQILSNLYLEVVRSLYTAVDLYYQFTLGDPEDKQDSGDNNQ